MQKECTQCVRFDAREDGKHSRRFQCMGKPNEQILAFVHFSTLNNDAYYKCKSDLK